MSEIDKNSEIDDIKADLKASEEVLEKARQNLAKARETFPWKTAISDMCAAAQKEDWPGIEAILAEVTERLFQFSIMEQNIRNAKRLRRGLDTFVQVADDIQNDSAKPVMEEKQLPEKEPETMYLEVQAYIDQMQTLFQEADDVVSKLNAGQSVDPLQSLPIIMQQIDALYLSLPKILGQQVDGALISMRKVFDLNSGIKIRENFSQIKIFIAEFCLGTALKFAQQLDQFCEFKSQMQATFQEVQMPSQEEVDATALNEMGAQLNQLIDEFGRRLAETVGILQSTRLLEKYDEWRKNRKEEL